MSEKCKSTEQMIQDKGLDAPRLTPSLIDSKVINKSFHKLTDVLTVCVLTLENGFTVTGESACASPENYNQEIGEKIAFENAREKIWLLEGYLLKQRLHELQLSKEVKCPETGIEAPKCPETGIEAPKEKIQGKR